MPLAILMVVVSIFIATTIIQTKYQQHIKSREVRLVDINSTTQRLQNIERISKHYQSKKVYKNATKEQELIEKILLRTCNTIYQKGIWYKCNNAVKADTVWKFVGAINTKGSLKDAWSGSTTSTFSCGSEAEYGRYLVQHSIDSHIIIDEKWGYNLEDVSNGASYPCGYSEIVTKD